MRVLLIEDEPTTAKAIELMLTTEGFNVYSTDLGEEGLDLGKLYDYDIILLDLNLPGTDGREVLEVVKADENLKTIPVIILTTSNDKRDVEDCYRNGANSYVQKPVDFRAFLSAVQSLKEFWFEIVLIPVEEFER